MILHEADLAIDAAGTKPPPALADAAMAVKAEQAE